MEIKGQQAITGSPTVVQPAQSTSTTTLQFTDIINQITPLLLMVLMFSVVRNLFSSTGFIPVQQTFGNPLGNPFGNPFTR